MLSKEAEKAIIEWEAMRPGIITAAFRTPPPFFSPTHTHTHTVITCDPVWHNKNNKSDSVKEGFGVKVEKKMALSKY